MDLHGKSLDELNALAAAIQAEKSAAVDREREEFEALVTRVKEMAKALGIKLKPYFTETVPGRQVKNPETGEVVTLRGPRPQWLKDLLEGLDKKAVKAKLDELKVAE